MKYFFSTLSIFVLAGFLAVSACDNGDGTSTFDPASSNDDGPPPDPDAAEHLYVRFLDSKDGEESFDTFSYQVLPTFDTTSTCKIDKTETANKDLSCVVDVNEQDLYFHGMRIEFVIPTGMCDYFSFSNTWHYDQEMGMGPLEIWIRKYVDDSGEEKGTPECFVKNSDNNWYPSDPILDPDPPDGGFIGTGDPCGNLDPNGSGLEVSYIDTQTTIPKCIYDKSSSGSLGDNCCKGKYNLTLEIVDNQNTTSDPVDGIGKGRTTQSQISWGPAEFGSCISGAAVVDPFWPKNSTGKPLSKIYYTREKGISERYEIPEPVKTFNYGDNHLVSNWHAFVEGADTRHQHTGPVSGRTSNLPIMFDPIEDRSGDYKYTAAQAPYEFHCLNENFETIHRLRWYIREYNTEEQFANFIANPVNGTQDADRNGVEGGGGVDDCEGFLGNLCNDRSDPDDFVPNAPGQSPPYDCSAGQGGLFGSYTGCFPYILDNF